MHFTACMTTTYNQGQIQNIAERINYCCVVLQVLEVKLDLFVQGGGYHFVRYNCTVVESYVGHALMYPGRLTHWHEELAVTRGTRYIVISFIEP